MKLITAGKKIIMPMCIALAVSGALSGCSEKSMDEHLTMARDYTQRQDTQAAVIEYKNAIRQNPQAPAPRFELGRLYLMSNQFEAAEKELNRAIELGHPASAVIPLLSQAYQQTGAENALVEMDYQVAGMSPQEQAEVGFYKLQALAQLDKKTEAQALISELRELDSDSVYIGLSEAYADILNTDYPAALEKTEQLAEQAPDNKDVLQQLGRLYALTKQPAEAIDVYKQYVELYPADITKQFALIGLLIENRRTEEAQPYVTPLLKKHPKNGLLNQYQGLIDSTLGRFESAQRHLEKAIQSGQSGPAARLVAGFSAYQLQDFAAASQHLSMVASTLPDNHPGLRMLADSLLRQGENEEASDILNRVGGNTEQDAELFSKAGFQLLREGNMVDAKKMIEKSGELSTSAADLARLGVLQLSVNDIEGIVNLETALEKAPDNVATQKTLMAAYVSTGQQQKARELAKQWLEQSPDDAVPYIYLAELAMKDNDMAQAKKLLESAKARAPQSRELTLASIKFDIIAQDYGAAQQRLEKLLKQNPADTQALSLLYSLAQGESAQAVEKIQKRTAAALQQAQDNMSLRILLARMQFAQQQYADVLTTLNSIKADTAAPVTFWNLKGQALIRTNDVAKANTHYKQWVNLYPLDKTAVLGKLLLNDAQGKYKEALVTVNQFLEKRPDTQIQVLKAYFLGLQQKTKEARRSLQEVPEQVLSLPFVKGITARLSLLEGNSEAALADAKVAYEHAQNPKNTLLVVAGYESSGQRQQAFDFLQQHYNNYPQDVRSALLYAERMISQNPAEAAQIYAKLLNAMPENFVVLNNLAYLYLEQGQIADAEPLARRAVALQPKNAEAVDTLAQILKQQQKTAEALSFYDKIKIENVGSDAVYLNYVELLITAQQRQLAKRRLDSRQFSQPEDQQRAQALRETL